MTDSASVWLVYADTHDYDYNSQWAVGVFSSEKLANEAAKRCSVLYWKAVSGSKKRGLPNIEITECILDKELVDV